jgi:hypothetical protein
MLIDEALPQFDEVETHAIEIEASPARACPFGSDALRIPLRGISHSESRPLSGRCVTVPGAD